MITIPKILFVLVVALVSFANQGCSENATKETKIVNLPIVIQYDYYAENFVNNGINYKDLLGEWKLIDTKFECALGELEHIEDGFELDEDDKKMIIGENELNKICFWNTPKFVNGVHETNLPDSIKMLNWLPENGAPITGFDINYTNEILKIYSRQEININENYYEGNLFESYKK